MPGTTRTMAIYDSDYVGGSEEDMSLILRRIAEIEAISQSLSAAEVSDFDAGDIARAMLLSRETASIEAVGRTDLDSAVVKSLRTATPTSVITPTASRSPSSHRAPSTKTRYPEDEILARRLARSWQVASFQPALIDAASISHPRPPSVRSHSIPLAPSSVANEAVRSTTSVSAKTSSLKSRSSSLYQTTSRDSRSDMSSSRQSRTITKSPRDSLYQASPNISSPEVELLLYRHLFIASRRCSTCGTTVKHPRITRDAHRGVQLPSLHMRCPTCNISQCRGCSSVTECSMVCSGQPGSCPASDCCAEARAIGIFEVLAAFDRDYMAENKGGSPRPAYLHTPEWHKSLVRTLQTIEIIFSSSSGLDSDDGSDDEGGAGGIHPSFRSLFALSYLPQAIQLILSQRNIGTWVAHSRTFTAVLSFLRLVVDCGFSQLLRIALPKIDPQRGEGLHGWMWDATPVVWEMQGGGGESSARSTGSVAGAGAVKEKASIVRCKPLYETIQELERGVRIPLREFASRIAFNPTVEKVDELCDGIMYLLLQRLAGT